MMRVTIVYGFLGAGKTTLLRHLLPELAKRERIGLLVNEFGDVGIDGEVLSTGDVQVKEIASGCICCALVGELSRALAEIHERWNPARLVIEPTGVAAPQSLAQVFASPPVRDIAVVDRIVTVVDAPRFLPSREVFAAFYTEQIRQAHALVLNKVDRAAPEEVAAVAQALAEMNPRAEVRATTYARVPIGWLVDGTSTSLQPEAHAAHVHDSAEGLSAHAVHAGRPTRPALETVLRRFDAGEFGEIVRAKGFVETTDGPLHVEYVPGQAELEPYAGDLRAFVVTGRGVQAEAIAAALRGA